VLFVSRFALQYMLGNFLLVVADGNKLQRKYSRNIGCVCVCLCVCVCGKRIFQMAQLRLGAANNKILLPCSQLQGKHTQLFVTTPGFIIAARCHVFLSKV
jgi:hypothetical protein